MAWIGFGVAALFYYRRSVNPADYVSAGAGKAVHTLLTQKYYLDHLYYGFAEKVVYAFTKACDAFDIKVIDGAGNAMGDGAVDAGSRWRKWTSGNVQHYAVGIVVGICMLLLLLRFALPPLNDLLGSWPGLSGWHWWEGWGW